MPVKIIPVGELAKLPIGHQVNPPCDGGEGIWCCTTHFQYLETPAEYDAHVAKGAHVVTFVCHRHGPEARGLPAS